MPTTSGRALSFILLKYRVMLRLTGGGLSTSAHAAPLRQDASISNVANIHRMAFLCPLPIGLLRDVRLAADLSLNGTNPTWGSVNGCIVFSPDLTISVCKNFDSRASFQN